MPITVLLFHLLVIIVNNYHNSYIRYERRQKSCRTLIGISITIIVAVLVRREMLNGKLTIVRVTEIPFHLPASHYMTSIELDGWGSCQVKDKFTLDVIKFNLHTHGIALDPDKADSWAPFVECAGHDKPYLGLDAWAWLAHTRSINHMKETNVYPWLPDDEVGFFDDEDEDLTGEG